MKNLTRFLAENFNPQTLVAALLVAVAGTIGCSSDSGVSPDTQNGFDDGQSIQVLDPGNAGMGRTLELPGGANGIETTIVVSKNVEPTKGAEIANGRFTMKVPAGALDYSAEFKMTQDPSESQVRCLLEPHATEFNAPVEVHFNLAGTDAFLHENVRAQWFDDASGQWKDVESHWDPETQILIGYFDHFCYGRAGW